MQLSKNESGTDIFAHRGRARKKTWMRYAHICTHILQTYLTCMWCCLCICCLWTFTFFEMRATCDSHHVVRVYVLWMQAHNIKLLFWCFRLPNFRLDGEDYRNWSWKVGGIILRLGKNVMRMARIYRPFELQLMVLRSYHMEKVYSKMEIQICVKHFLLFCGLCSATHARSNK